MNARRGFTLIEILVVITVIGVLAAVTSVSYRHITKRAEQSARIADADSVYKHLNAYLVRHQALPFGSGDTRMISSLRSKWGDEGNWPSGRSEKTCEGSAARWMSYTDRSRLLNFQGCYALEPGQMWNDHDSMFERDYIDRHGLSEKEIVDVMWLALRYDENSDRRWKDFFVQIPEIANIDIKARKLYVRVYIYAPFAGRAKYCYKINDIKEVCSTGFYLSDINHVL